MKCVYLLSREVKGAKGGQGCLSIIPCAPKWGLNYVWIFVLVSDNFAKKYFTTATNQKSTPSKRPFWNLGDDNNLILQAIKISFYCVSGWVTN